MVMFSNLFSTGEGYYQRVRPQMVPEHKLEDAYLATVRGSMFACSLGELTRYGQLPKTCGTSSKAYARARMCWTKQFAVAANSSLSLRSMAST